MQDSRYKIQDTRIKMRVLSIEYRVSSIKMQESSIKNQDARIKMQDARIKMRVSSIKKQDAGHKTSNRTFQSRGTVILVCPIACPVLRVSFQLYSEIIYDHAFYPLTNCLMPIFPS